MSSLKNQANMSGKQISLSVALIRAYVSHRYSHTSLYTFAHPAGIDSCGSLFIVQLKEETPFLYSYQDFIYLFLT